jgi:hypothetical protein
VAVSDTDVVLADVVLTTNDLRRIGRASPSQSLWAAQDILLKSNESRPADALWRLPFRAIQVTPLVGSARDNAA